MLLVNDVRLRAQTPDCSPLVLRLNEYCLLPFSTQMGEPGLLAHGFMYVLVEETGVTMSFVTLPCASLTLFSDSSSKALVMKSDVLVLVHLTGLPLAIVNLMANVFPVTTGTRGS